MNEHVLKICKLVGSAIVGLFGFLIAIVGIAKEGHKMNDEATEDLKADDSSDDSVV